MLAGVGCEVGDWGLCFGLEAVTVSSSALDLALLSLSCKTPFVVGKSFLEGTGSGEGMGELQGRDWFPLNVVAVCVLGFFDSGYCEAKLRVTRPGNSELALVCLICVPSS